MSSYYLLQKGKIAVIGGCREYTGAPYFAAISALKIGADLSHVFCTKDAASVIKSYSPELIVHPVLEESYSVRDDEKGVISGKVLSEVDKWMERFDCLVIGPGLGRDPFLLDCVSKIIKLARQSNVPIVIDGDGLFLVTNSLDLISGYPLAVLTPNVNEYKRLVQKVLSCEVNDEEAHEQLLSLAKRQERVIHLGYITRPYPFHFSIPLVQAFNDPDFLGEYMGSGILYCRDYNLIHGIGDKRHA
ncbi:ATP-dependent (S)-NAD(P)H-hydrate dehydratase isoform X2 [Prunus yedoensis var. nudiflora]|uniref:ATP-dependent (S)-NAD(P)H-hydrate dehydratase n=1 Tax=Prunus yedoensis var. nudiflora TaxID=2094558 RepID=A0A314Z9X8_PRUYE|nr:ATP-dependent (S)-NAD(P)H-hydrate dehydratase isoform X2 [Prunus yedoensis var. nudiflora]